MFKIYFSRIQSFASESLKKISGEQISPKIQNAIKEDDKILEAIAALQVLGYHRKEIEKAFQKMKDKQSLSTEELIKKGLSVLGMQV